MVVQYHKPRKGPGKITQMVSDSQVGLVSQNYIKDKAFWKFGGNSHEVFHSMLYELKRHDPSYRVFNSSKN